MTLPASGAISLTDVMTELRTVNAGRAYPISLGDADVLALAGVAGPANSLSNLYGKSAYTAMTVTGVSDTSSMAGNTTGLTYTGHSHPSVTVSGGSGSYTYLWTITGGSFTLTNSTLQTCDVAHVIAPSGFTGTCTLSCAVTDSIPNTVTQTGIQAVFTA